MIILGFLGMLIFGGALTVLILPELMGVMLPSVVAIIGYWCIYRVVRKVVKKIREKTE